LGCPTPKKINSDETASGAPLNRLSLYERRAAFSGPAGAFLLDPWLFTGCPPVLYALSDD